MRRRHAPSEIGRLAAPLAGALDGAWRRMHWWVATMAVLYACSGITVVKPNEVAVILRWGRLVGATPALQAHGPGLLFALPRPIDRVVRVPVKHVWETTITTLAGDETNTAALSLDPLTQGYALTGDQNIVQVRMVARYRVRDPAEWAFYGAPSEDILRVEVSAALVRSLGEMGIDRVLADGRTALIDTATRRAQAGLDASRSGLELASLELTRLAPPVALSGDFDDVQSAFIGAETQQQDAKAYAESAIPQSQAMVDSQLQTARGDADAARAAARGEASAFRALEAEYRANPLVVRERLYREAVEKAIGVAGSVRWVPPPPPGGKYNGFRITLVPPVAGAAGAPPAGAGEDDEDR